MSTDHDWLTGTFLEGMTSFSMPSTATGISYRVNVSVPAARGGESQRYPLLLVLDGCMQFGRHSQPWAAPDLPI